MTKGLVALIQSKTAITNLIGTNPMRLFPRMLPQGLSTFPAMTYMTVDIVPTNTFDGGSTYDFSSVDLQCYAKTYSDVTNLFETGRKQLEDSTGTYNTIEIDHVWYMTSGAEDYLEDLELWTKQLELRIAYRRIP